MSSNPFVHQQPPQETYKGLIRFAQILSVFLFVFMIAVFVRTKQKIAARGPQEEILKMMAQLRADSLRIATQTSDIAVDMTSANMDAQQKEQENAKLYSSIRISIPDTASDKAQVLFVLNVIEKQTNEMCQRIRDAKKGFNDTLTALGNPDDFAVTENYFVTSGRASRLRLAIGDYRTGIFAMVNNFPSYSESELKDELPLDDQDYYGENLTWDTDKFSSSPVTLNDYLDALESEVRSFEHKALTGIPYSQSYVN